jgi:hypothetical protein
MGLYELKALFGDDTWIIQNRIKNQAPQYAIFHPQSINTFRVITVKSDLGIKVLRAFFRIGVNGRHTDNFSSGGIIVDVNIENGKLEKFGFFKPGFGTKGTKHPNSHLVYEGFLIQHWEDIVEYVIKAHSLFYGIHSIGWDVAVTDEDIVLIEGNDNWETTFFQLHNGFKNEFDKYFS